MKWFTIKVVFPLICLLVSLIITESLSNRKIRNKSYPRTPPIQVNKRLLKRKQYPQSKPLSKSKTIDPKLKKRQFIVPIARPTPVGLFSNNLARALLIPAIPTLIGKIFTTLKIDYKSILGLGVGLAFIASQTNGLTASISSIGSPKTNVTVAMENNNSPVISQTMVVTNTATNLNSDNDQITQSNTVTVTNTNNSGRKRRKRRVIVDDP